MLKNFWRFIEVPLYVTWFFDLFGLFIIYTTPTDPLNDMSAEMTYRCWYFGAALGCACLLVNIYRSEKKQPILDLGNLIPNPFKF